MSTDFPPTPSIDARVQALERLTTTLNARIEQLSQDMSASFRQAAAYQLQTERKIEARFDAIDASIARLASKEDMGAMKSEILSAFNQLLSILDTRLPPKEG